MGSVYVLHFDQPLAHARHYIGYTDSADVEPRVEQHRAGNGARIVAAVVRAGIGFKVARTFSNATRHDERYLKNLKSPTRICPICCGGRVPRIRKLER